MFLIIFIKLDIIINCNKLIELGMLIEWVKLNLTAINLESFISNSNNAKKGLSWVEFEQNIKKKLKN